MTFSTNPEYMLINKYLQQVQDIYLDNNQFLMFRGQPSCHRSLDAPISRKYGTPEFIKNTQNLVNQAKLKGYDKKEFSRLSDLEILADLQHHGAATCLMDFTKNFLTALYFACQTGKNNNPNDGCVFVMKSSQLQKMEVEDMQKDITEILNQEKLFYWIPSQINKRIIAQQGVFLTWKAHCRRFLL